MKIYANKLLRFSKFRCDALMGYDTKHFEYGLVNRKSSLRSFQLSDDVKALRLHNPPLVGCATASRQFHRTTRKPHKFLHSIRNSQAILSSAINLIDKLRH